MLAVVALRRGEDALRAAAPLTALAAAQVLEAVAFVTLSRPGPDGADVSFSSGDAMTAALGWGLVARLVGGRAAGAVAVALAATAGLTRVALELRWLSRGSGCR